MRVSMRKNPPTVRCKKSGNGILYTGGTAINISQLVDFLTSLAEVPTSSKYSVVHCNNQLTSERPILLRWV
jgi:hypothetical protein